MRPAPYTRQFSPYSRYASSSASPSRSFGHGLRARGDWPPRRPGKTPTAPSSPVSTLWATIARLPSLFEILFGLVGDAARGHGGRNNELPVHELSVNRRGAPSAICRLSFCAGGLRRAERKHREEREDKPRADAEAGAAEPHRARMARGQSRRIGRSAHFQLRQVLSSGGLVTGLWGGTCPNPCLNAHHNLAQAGCPIAATAPT